MTTDRELSSGIFLLDTIRFNVKEQSMNEFDSPLPGLKSQSFRDRADAAAFWEAWTGAVLTRCGLYVLLNPWAINAQDNSKSFDLGVSSIHPQEMSDAAGPRPLEVKSLNLGFKDPASYPYDTVLVCSQSNFLKKWPGSDQLGRDFMLVSRQTGHLVWVPDGTKVNLGHETFDRTRSERLLSATVPKTALRTLSEYVHTFGVKHG